MTTEPAAPPAIARLISVLLLSPPVFDRLGYLVGLGVSTEARQNGGAPSQHSLRLQTLIADAGREARVLSRLSCAGSGSGAGVTSSPTMLGTAEAATLLGVCQRTMQRRANEYGGRLVGGVWRLDRATVEAAASGIGGVDG